MKKVVIGMAIGVLVLAGSAGAALMNPGFETEGNWALSFYGSYVYGGRADGSSHSGTSSLHFWDNGPSWWVSPWNSDGYARSDSFAVTGGQDYTLAAYSMMDAISGSCIQLMINFDNGGGDSVFLTPGSSWGQYQISGTVPAGATSATVRLAGCFAAGYVPAGHIYFDDVSYVETPEPATMGLMILGGLFLRRRK